MLRKRYWPALVLILPLALAMGACGDDDDDGNGNGDTDAGVTDAGGDQDAGDEDAGNGCEPGEVTISGTASIFPAASMATTTTVEGAELSLQEASGIISGTPSFLTYGADCEDAITTLDDTGEWSFEQLAGQVTFGIISVIDDATDAPDDQFVLTGTGIASALEDTTGASAFAVPQDFVAQVETAAGLEAGSLESQGFIIGQFLQDMTTPAAGVTVVTNGGGPIAEVIYPTADLSGTGDTTSATGLFIYPGAPSVPQEYCGSSDGTTQDFGCQRAGAAPGAAFAIVLFPAQ